MKVSSYSCREGADCDKMPCSWTFVDSLFPQLAGYFPDTISKCAELVNTYCEVDFVDLNVGCPIDLVYQKVKELLRYLG